MYWLSLLILKTNRYNWSRLSRFTSTCLRWTPRHHMVEAAYRWWFPPTVLNTRVCPTSTWTCRAPTNRTICPSRRSPRQSPTTRARFTRRSTLPRRTPSTGPNRIVRSRDTKMTKVERNQFCSALRRHVAKFDAVLSNGGNEQKRWNISWSFQSRKKWILKNALRWLTNETIPAF